ncbi:MAG: guanylate kinase [Candidatus Omnitrophota bacterium]
MAVKLDKIKGVIFVVSGPSGSGKTTLLKKLLLDRSLRKVLVKSISLTTRPQRSNEHRGQDYSFITEKDFRRAQKAKKILEWTRYLGYHYATPKEFVDKQVGQGKHIVLCLDLKGALTIKRSYPENSVTIFVGPPSLRTLQQRIVKRCHKTKKEEIGERLKLARKEILGSCLYDHCLVNNNLARAVKALKKIIVQEISTRSEGAYDIHVA